MKSTTCCIGVLDETRRRSRALPEPAGPHGNDAAEHDQHVIHSSWRSSSIRRGQIELCAPDRIDKPITSASSCSAAATICSGVCRRPVNHLHAGAAQRARYLGAAIVPVQARLGDHHASFGLHHRRSRSQPSPDILPTRPQRRTFPERGVARTASISTGIVFVDPAAASRSWSSARRTASLSRVRRSCPAWPAAFGNGFLDMKDGRGRVRPRHELVDAHDQLLAASTAC